MDRFAVTRMKCMLCFEEQPVGQRCSGCHQDMGRYYCQTCRLIDDGPDKHIFHCEQCGICLSGRRSDYYHCSVCDACVAVDARERHSCKEKRLQCTCPICDEWLSDSVKSIVQPECQHLMHESCLSRHMEHSYKCPVCSASLCDTRDIFDSIECYLRLSVMPLEYKDKMSLIFCNDCRQRSVTKFHFLYHKCQARRDELLTSKLWINDLKSQYIRSIVDCAKELPTDLERFPSSIHAYVEYYSNSYALNREALVAYRAQAIFAERMGGAAFIPNDSELKKLEMSVLEEERLLEQVQVRLSEKVQAANEKIDSECQRYEDALWLAQENDVLAKEVSELEAELETLAKALEEKEAKERDAVEQQTRELQAVHNDLLREAAMREDVDREQVRLEDRLLRLKNDEQKRRMSAADSQEQQKLVERWIRSIAPVVNARVENSTLILTLGEGLGAMSGRRILVGFSPMGNVTSVETDDGRRFPPVLNHDTLMKLLSE
ncbi:hypothetical protein GGF41_001558 [Coemansia sp. RSA 2531]|nr:hypothetical protein GGF41_001558 [Coemansia sp. RSA 2531]